MADSKLADLTSATTLGGDEYVYIVDDPAGTPLDRKVTVTLLRDRPADTSPKGSDATEYLSVPGVVMINVTTILMIADVARYVPFVVDTPCTLDELYCEVTTLAASSAIRFAIYKADTDWQPTTRVADLGTVASTSTGVKSITGLAQALTRGRHMILFHSNGGATIRGFSGSPFGSPLLKALGTTPFIARLDKTGTTYAAAADPGVQWDGASAQATTWRYPCAFRMEP